LLIIAVALAAANLWFAAIRSTIPLALDDIVGEREIRIEKHPGVDDVYLLTMKRAGTRQVDKPVYDQVKEGDRLRKRAWETRLMAGQRIVRLVWSADARGLAAVMPAVLIIVAGTTLMTRRAKPAQLP
jgi:hypothetical protein